MHHFNVRTQAGALGFPGSTMTCTQESHATPVGLTLLPCCLRGAWSDDCVEGVTVVAWVWDWCEAYCITTSCDPPGTFSITTLGRGSQKSGGSNLFFLYMTVSQSSHTGGERSMDLKMFLFLTLKKWKSLDLTTLRSKFSTVPWIHALWKFFPKCCLCWSCDFRCLLTANGNNNTGVESISWRPFWESTFKEKSFQLP